MTNTELHVMAIQITLPPCLAVFGVVWGLMFGHWIPVVLGAAWIIDAAWGAWIVYYVRRRQ